MVMGMIRSGREKWWLKDSHEELDGLQTINGVFGALVEIVRVRLFRNWKTYCMEVSTIVAIVSCSLIVYVY